MGRFAKVWPDELQHEIVSAVLDRGLTVRKACGLAMSGQLDTQVPDVEGLDREEIARRLEKNAYTWTSRAKRERAGAEVPTWIPEQGAERSIETLTVRIVGIAHTEVRAIERTRAGKRDLDRLRKATQVLREAQALVRKDAPTRSARARDASVGKPVAPDGTAEAGAMGLIGAMRASEIGESPRPDDTTHDTAGRESEAHTRDNGQTEAGILTRTGAQQSAEERRRAELAEQLGIEMPVTERD